MEKKSIQTIILCGGKGTRLKEETEFKPKPMVMIGEKPLLWHIMKIYSHYGYNDFILALGYKGNYIKDYFLKQKHYTSDFLLNTTNGAASTFFPNDGIKKDHFNIIFADTGLETPHGERVLRLKKYINEDLFMVTFGDGVANIDINKLVEFHKKHGRVATVTGVHPRSKYGLVKVDGDNLVTTFDQKPRLYDYVAGGFMVFDKRFFDFIKAGDMIEGSLARLIPQKQLILYKFDGFWYAVDTYKEYEELNKMWRERNRPWKLWE